MSNLIAIISYNINSKHLNYGAALHSYAFQKYLEKLGCKSVIINYTPLKIENYHIKYPILNRPFSTSFKGYMYHFCNWGLGFFSNLRKYRKFQRFFHEKTYITRNAYQYKDLINLSRIENYDFDTFVCESDVIWKTYDDIKFDDILYLNFPAANNKKKVAYSPSLSSKPFNSEELATFKQLVSSFSAISCREQQGAKYLSDILGKNIEWVLDPTLLLDAEDYKPIIKEPKEKGYILLYNCMVNDQSMVKEAIKYAQKKGKKLIEVSNWYVNKLYYNHTVKTDLGIEEFLGYFKNADEVICNAFHGLCFSVIFKKEFYLFIRDETDYRMQSITNALGLSSRLVLWSNRHIPTNVQKINYPEVYYRIAVHRKRSHLFINKINEK